MKVPAKIALTAPAAFTDAGVFDVYAPLAEFSEERLSEAFDELFGVNVKGCFFGAKAALPELMKTEGSMVFTASVAGFNSGGGGTLYTASKHAVVGLIRQLAVEVGPRVRVNGVAPGPIWTPLQVSGGASQEKLKNFGGQTPLGRPGQPAELASIYVQLAANDASFATGQVYGSSGGAGQP